MSDVKYTFDWAVPVIMLKLKRIRENKYNEYL